MNNETNQTDDKRTNIVLDATMFDTFLSCPQKFYIRHVLNRVPPAPAKPLDRGGLIHLGFEAYYRSLQIKPQWDEAMNAMSEAYDLAVAGMSETTLTPEETNYIKECMIQSCNVHRSTDLQYEILAVEESFMYELYEDDLMRIIMIGKIDLLVNYQNYKAMPIDHKSYERDFPVHRKTNQFQNYAYATNSNYLLVNRVGMQKSIKPIEKHKRTMLSYDPLILNQWRDNVIKWSKYYMECAALNSWPLNDTSCDKFNRLCEYYQICDSSGSEAKTHKLNMYFREAPKWDVSQSLGKKDA